MVTRSRLANGGDQQAGEVGGPGLSAAPQRCLDVQRAPPVLIVGGEPFAAEVPVIAELAGFRAGLGGPAEFGLDHAASQAAWAHGGGRLRPRDA